ncbi:undecaprenyl-phosphate galactose phosphotransferase WbaP [Deinococcus yavapaiensis]|uniref:Undecaprenyl-phosphate galactose phosphotransferase WbaP/exopolysaccharide biosynthesis polyprenyl glycosylphosphotransferase n=1 Tax=Deinococcus yavapaiensis KR-236 TaxID=694435 RepID=A0A318SED3_9DEIO|nr:undecaprenyl-phosphate galactose phosphotransferase WbaP [Deinococcus yavapaiensis]PYE55898.1 Undecaprenyl-phosphate galactose phosphotransferase WbaP/exopolysaccharide biosynthesis polyprenyl glycosylphosphotransferase [Deinococcus yavapaiensis KR-236]
MRNTLPSASSAYPAGSERKVGLSALHTATQGAVFAVIDFLVAWGCWEATLAILHAVGSTPPSRAYVLVWIALWLALRAYQGSYPGLGRSPQTELRLHTVSTFYTILAQLAVTFAVHALDKSRLGIGLLWLLILLFGLPARALTRSFLIRFGWFGRPVSIIGAGKTGAATVRHLLAQPQYGLNPTAVYDDNEDLVGAALHGVPIVGTIQDAVERPQAVHAIISIPGARADVQRVLVNSIYEQYPVTWVTPDLPGVPNQALLPHSIGVNAALEIRNNLRSVRSRFIKRTIDLFAAFVGGVLISPILLLIALAITLDSPGPIVYRARRLGRGGREFACLKFRTMHRDADAKLQALLRVHPELREEFEATHKLRVDPRVTRVGTWLRRTSLDELPQLLNVLRGEMSLVGPRPIVEAETSKYGSIFGEYCRVMPGMTGYWQVNGRSDTTYEERVAMDNFYITNWSPWLDLVILMQTVHVVFKGRGAY